MDEAITNRSRRNQNAIDRALREVTQAKVAERLGLSTSGLSDWLGKQKDVIGRLCEILACLGLKVAPVATETVSPAQLRAMQIIVKEHMEQQLDVPDSAFGNF